MTEISPPHFTLPMRLAVDTFATNNQGSVEDIGACAEAIVRTRPAERELLPDLGTFDLTFLEQPVDLSQMLAAIETWEPRARTAAEQNPDYFDALIARLSVEVAHPEEADVA